jgi:hypothetical protein
MVAISSPVAGFSTPIVPVSGPPFASTGPAPAGAGSCTLAIVSPCAAVRWENMAVRAFRGMAAAVAVMAGWLAIGSGVALAGTAASIAAVEGQQLTNAAPPCRRDRRLRDVHEAAERGVEQRHLEAAACSRPRALRQRGEDTDRRVHPAEDVDDRDPTFDGGPSHSPVMLMRPDSADLEVLDHHIGARDQPLHHRASARVGEIERDAALAAMQRQVGPASTREKSRTRTPSSGAPAPVALIPSRLRRRRAPARTPPRSARSARSLR